MNENKGIWIGVVVFMVIGALGLWWIAASRPLNSSTGWFGVGQTATTTATSTPRTGVSPSVTRTRSSSDVVSIIAGLSGASQFNTQFRASGVASSISASGKYTIFVPTNGAFSQLAAGTISSMTAAEKKRLVQYHVISGSNIDVDTFIAGQMTALSKDVLNFSFSTQKIPMVNSAIVIAEYTGKNGTVYLIDNVLLPPKKAGI